MAFNKFVFGAIAKIETTNGTVFDHCFYYKFGSSFDELSVLNSDVWTKFSSDGICKGYGDAGDASDAELRSSCLPRC
ncbi:hypothetical protein V7S43_015289 [Phytophthora oleae]|uniref:Pectate lyase n=1 Tax=Phytophthora oleae TaxID=2107226 RepID=A0ABD3EYQ8_9STRA